MCMKKTINHQKTLAFCCLIALLLIAFGPIGCGQTRDENLKNLLLQSLETKPENDLKITARLDNEAELAASPEEDRNITFIIQNVGAAQGDSVLVVVTPPLGAVVSKLSSQQGDCRADGQVPDLYWLCELGNLPIGASAMVAASVQPSFDNKKNPQTVTAAVTSSAPDHTPANNTTSIDIFTAYLALAGGGLSCATSVHSLHAGFNHKVAGGIVMLTLFALLIAALNRHHLKA